MSQVSRPTDRARGLATSRRAAHLHGFDGGREFEVGVSRTAERAALTREKLFTLFPNLGEMRKPQGGHERGEAADADHRGP